MNRFLKIGIEERARIRDERAKHAHVEAFCLMTYETVDDGEPVTERIWNSRDGVTPFCIRTRDGKREMQHVRWNEDRYRPDHRPEAGDRVFVDMTEGRAVSLVRARQAERGFDDDTARAILANMTRPGAPTIVTVVDPENFGGPER
jgi:hypothetical protein